MPSCSAFRMLYCKGLTAATCGLWGPAGGPYSRHLLRVREASRATLHRGSLSDPNPGRTPSFDWLLGELMLRTCACLTSLRLGSAATHTDASLPRRSAIISREDHVAAVTIGSSHALPETRVLHHGRDPKRKHLEHWSPCLHQAERRDTRSRDPHRERIASGGHLAILSSTVSRGSRRRLRSK